MKIIHIIDTLNWGGAQKLLLTFVENASDSEITIISLRDNLKPRSIKHFFLSHGINVEIANADKLLNFSRIRRLIKLLRRENADVIHTHLSYANILGGLCGYISNIPVVATLHNSSYDPQKTSKPVIFLETVVLKYLVKEIIAVGSVVEQAHRIRFKNKRIHIIQNSVNRIKPISDQEKTNLKRELLGAGDHTVMIAVGRLSPQKAYIDLLNAFSRIIEHYPESRLLVVGEGKERKNLEEKLREFSLQEKVLLLGERDDVPKLLQISDIFINSSHWEGLPVSILEAMSVGLPIIATKVGDIPNVITEEDGLLVDPNPDSILNAMLTYLASPKLMINHGKNAQEQFLKNFNAPAWTQKIFEVYKQVLNG